MFINVINEHFRCFTGFICLFDLVMFKNVIYLCK